MTQTALNWQSGQNESLRHQIGYGSWTLPEDALLESILSEHANVRVAVETWFEEEKFSSVNYEAAQLTAMLRSGASKRAMLIYSFVQIALLGTVMISKHLLQDRSHECKRGIGRTIDISIVCLLQG